VSCCRAVPRTQSSAPSIRAPGSQQRSSRKCSTPPSCPYRCELKSRNTPERRPPAAMATPRDSSADSAPPCNNEPPNGLRVRVGLNFSAVILFSAPAIRPRRLRRVRALRHEHQHPRRRPRDREKGQGRTIIAVALLRSLSLHSHQPQHAYRADLFTRFFARHRGPHRQAKLAPLSQSHWVLLQRL
jgi:hypothetical protein